MSYHGGRRNFKIVEELPQVPGRENEIIGGVRNALERGQELQTVKKSFLNAGYKIEEIEAAVKQVPQISSKLSKPLVESSDNSNINNSAKKESEEKNSASKGLIIALIAMIVLVIVGGIFIYLFRDKLF